LINVTFSGNTAIHGGGMVNIYNSNPTVRNSILWGDNGSIGAEIYNDASTATVTFSDVAGGYPGMGNLNADPKLSALGNNGGSTQTMKLGPTSAAIDAADATNCPTTDQRGKPRNDLHCDIGAYEMQITDGNWVVKTPLTTTLTTYGSALVGIRDSGSTHPGMITATQVTNWTGGTPANAIGAWWDISATTSSGLNVTLELCYRDSESNSRTLGGLSFWRYSGSVWNLVGAPNSTNRDDNGNNCATRNSVTSLSRWTLATGDPGGTPTGVFLLWWRAIPEPNAVRLEWRTMLGADVMAYQVERALDGKTFTAIGNSVLAIGDGTGRVLDTTLPRGKTATYRLIAIKTNGTREVIGTVTGSMGSQLFLPFIQR